MKIAIKTFLLFISLLAVAGCEDDSETFDGTTSTIYYTTRDGKPIDVYTDRNVVSNKYNDTTGVLTISGTHLFNYFRDNSRLESVTIPDNIKSVELDAFFGCIGLKAAYISDLSAWCRLYFHDYSANPTSYAKNLYMNGEEVKELVIPEDIKEVQPYAFRNCLSLNSVVFHDSVAEIGFCAFYDCTRIDSVIIGSGIEDISGWAFNNCKILKTVYCKAMTPPEIGNNIFYRCNKLEYIYVPSGSEHLYKEKWRQYSQYIKGYIFDE